MSTGGRVSTPKNESYGFLEIHVQENELPPIQKAPGPQLGRKQSYRVGIIQGSDFLKTKLADLQHETSAT